MRVIGIDPGKTGGVAVISPGYMGEAIDLWPMPEDINYTASRLYLLKKQGDFHVFMEKAQSFPGQGIASAFNYGCHFGELKGVLTSLLVPYTLVHPRVWTRMMHLGTKEGDAKKRSLEAAQRLFPCIRLTATDKCRRAHDGLVDALLLAEYGRRILAGSK